MDKTLYGTWGHMKSRCYNPNSPDFPLYGGRGISVSKEWQSYEQFYIDMFPVYQKGLTLDRVDNNKGYSKENCRWATPKEQANNTRKNRIIEYRGITKTMIQWAEYLGIKYKTLSQRINAYNWPIEKCFNQPIQLKKGVHFG